MSSCSVVRALRDAGLLDGLTIRVVLTGDEERPGDLASLARADLVAARGRRIRRRSASRTATASSARGRPAWLRSNWTLCA